jgi:16S rRNA (adenine1518-N6/adenine1519-N6)-dimethyltransferase
LLPSGATEAHRHRPFELKGKQILAPARLSRKKTGFHAKKSLGQHFLIDRRIIEEILLRADFLSTDTVLEVGPGMGALTLPLAGSVTSVVAVEKDNQLVDLLKKKVAKAGITNVEIIHGDILKYDLSALALPASGKVQIIGNLPYNISSPFLEHITVHRKRLGRAVLMLQHEFARRVTAAPGTRACGSLTLWAQYHAHPTTLLEVPGRAFSPQPKVSSMVIELDYERPYPRRAKDEALFTKVVKGAFAHRRKTVLNSLKGSLVQWNAKMILQALIKCGIEPHRRAETLAMEDFLCLTEALRLTNQSFNDK